MNQPAPPAARRSAAAHLVTTATAARSGLGSAGDALLTVLAGVALAVFSFQAGGFFPGVTAAGAVCLLVALAIRVAFARRPFAGLSLPYVVVAVALAMFAAWTLVSRVWSDAPARAVVEYDRALLYLCAFVLVGALGRTTARLRWMIRALAAAAVVVCVCALITRLLPDVWPVDREIALARLNWPLTYWNALGLVAALGLVLCFAMTCDERESRIGRVLSAAALPALAVTLLMTFSRGSIAVAVVGVAAFVVVGRPRALVNGLLVAAPTVGFALLAGYRADLLATSDPLSVAAVAQGHDVAVTAGVCVVLAALGRAALLSLDARWAVLESKAAAAMPSRSSRWLLAGGAALAVVGVALVLSLPSTVQEQYDRFVNGRALDARDDRRDRLTNPDNNGRIVQWRVALDAFREQPLRGEGAGTYALRWDRERPAIGQIEDAHSLYAEVLGELGTVGFALLVVALLTILGGFAALARGPDRAVGGALFAAGLMWALHAGIEWDWEMPAVTLWLFAAGGLALAAPRSEHRPVRRRMPVPVAVGGRIALSIGCVVLMLLPLAVYRSSGPLRAAASAFAVGDCPRAIDRALRSTEILEIRPEPYVIVGYCDVSLRRPDLAARAFRDALRRDPGNWEMHYGLALARAAAGRDPRPELRRARRLNPNHALPAKAVVLFDSDNPRVWRDRVPRAALPG